MPPPGLTPKRENMLTQFRTMQVFNFGSSVELRVRAGLIIEYAYIGKKTNTEYSFRNLWLQLFVMNLGGLTPRIFTHRMCASLRGIQDIQDGSFRAEQLPTNPTNLNRCIQPLMFLGEMHRDWWNTFVNNIGLIPVPGEALS